MSEAILPDIIVGVDIYKHTHAAVFIAQIGAGFGELMIQIIPSRYCELEAWARLRRADFAFSTEGTCAYRAGKCPCTEACRVHTRNEGMPEGSANVRRDRQ